MKKPIRIILVALFSAISWMNYAQERSLQFIRPAGQDGVNVFESPKEDTVNFEGVKVHLGGAFAIQFQSLSNENRENNLTELGSDFNLPTANLDIDAQLYDGIRMHLRTYLSSRHHQEAWVKGGHIQIDKLDFVKPGFLEGLMESISIRIGLDEYL